MPSSQVDISLTGTSTIFADACNYVLDEAIKAKTDNAIKLHRLCYSKVRENFGLSANLTIRALRRVAGNMRRLKGRRKKPRQYRPKSIDYDARIFYYSEKDQSISLRTQEKRVKIPLKLGDYQKKLLAGKKPTSATVIKKGNTWYIHMIVNCETSLGKGNGAMGIDLGIVNIAATSTVMKIVGKTRRKYKEKRAKIHASLQSKGTRGAKKVLKRKSGEEKRRIRHENHILSKKLVEEAKRHKCATIRMEQLKDIRDKTKTWNKHRNRMVASWSFYQLQRFITYKAAECGITVELINPAYSSQTCHQCQKLGSRERERFKCLTCGEMDADINAALVISKGGAACKPARISSVS